MHVYFVRHGETELNRRYIHQSPSTPLSPRGRDQALSVARALQPLRPDAIFTSDYTRALETARIIGSVIGVTPTVDPHFHEVVRPSSLCGRSLFHPKTGAYILTSVLKRRDPTWRYEDAENFVDIYARAVESLSFLESLAGKYESVVVVSHTLFINIMTEYMCKNRILAVRDLLPSFLHMHEMDNGEVVAIKYVGGEGRRVCKWQLVHHAR